MPLQLPNLDDRTYDDLVAEALSLIPTYAPEWTNHNPSDPGIALIELFAYLTEMLIYRLNQVTDDNFYTFLRLLNGPDWQPSGNLQQDIRGSVLQIRDRYRAVTGEDFEFLSLQEFEQAIARTTCVPERNLEALTEDVRKQRQPGHISLVILPTDERVAANELGPQPTPEQREALWKFLDQRRLITVRHHVVGPFYVPVSAEILVARRPDAVDEVVRQRIVDAIAPFLNPKQWPFGRAVYVSEFYELLEQVEGVDFLADIMLDSQCGAQDLHCVTAEPIWHETGDFVGLRLYDHHLPAARIDPTRIVVAPSANFLGVQLQVRVTATAGAELSVVRRTLATQLRRFFHPLHGIRALNPSGAMRIRVLTNPLRLRLISLGSPPQFVEQNSRDIDLAAILGVGQVTAIAVQSLSTRQSASNSEVFIQAGQVIDLRLRVDVQQFVSSV
ncbi:MAG: hypothetical protein HC866_24345 [Leptolyngbyaceae cyanobacterium RU_5_1]|nr:hypothetical protein [Leptolyngbyaceae cyanobacterium RU_5_1]